MSRLIDRYKKEGKRSFPFAVLELIILVGGLYSYCYLVLMFGIQMSDVFMMCFAGGMFLVSSVFVWREIKELTL